jgi:cell division protein FtsB
MIPQSSAGFLMTLIRTLKRSLRLVIAPSLFLSVTAYFAWSVTQGDRGSYAYAQAQERLVQAKAELARTEGERDIWERRVAGLRNSRLDPDTLDERARAMLNVANPGDIVVPYGPGKRLF